MRTLPSDVCWQPCQQRPVRAVPRVLPRPHQRVHGHRQGAGGAQGALTSAERQHGPGPGPVAGPRNLCQVYQPHHRREMSRVCHRLLQRLRQPQRPLQAVSRTNNLNLRKNYIFHHYPLSFLTVLSLLLMYIFFPFNG